MQVHHERINISANGFFNLNLDFLGSVIKIASRDMSFDYSMHVSLILDTCRIHHVFSYFDSIRTLQ